LHRFLIAIINLEHAQSREQVDPLAKSSNSFFPSHFIASPHSSFLPASTLSLSLMFGSISFLLGMADRLCTKLARSLSSSSSFLTFTSLAPPHSLSPHLTLATLHHLTTLLFHLDHASYYKLPLVSRWSQHFETSCPFSLSLLSASPYSKLTRLSLQTDTYSHLEHRRQSSRSFHSRSFFLLCSSSSFTSTRFQIQTFPGTPYSICLSLGTHPWTGSCNRDPGSRTRVDQS